MAVRGARHRWTPVSLGNNWDASVVPTPDKSRTMRGPDPVDAHPNGASPFGVMDMVGNVWQWTDEFQDEHTRGGNPSRRQLLSAARFQVVFPARIQTSEHGKLLLMSPVWIAPARSDSVW